MTNKEIHNMFFKRTSLSEQVYLSIVNYIQSHNLQCGDRLPTEAEFSKLFQVSRTSIREAMKVLSINGTVKAVPGKGTFLCSPTINFAISPDFNTILQANISISHIMEVRTAVELLAADLAIDRATDTDIISISEAMETLRQAVLSGKSWATEGAQFHIKIAESTKNPLIVKLVETYSDTVGKYRDALVKLNTKEDMDHHIIEHEAILNALCARNKKAMRAAVLNHMESTERNIKLLVNKDSAIDFIEK